MEELRRSLSDVKWLDSLSVKDSKELENYICSQQTKIDEWKEKFEVHRCTCEQQYFELEKQLITANTKLETESNSSAEFKEKNQELEKKFKEASTKLKVLQDNHEDNESSRQRLCKEKEQLECEKRLAALIEKRSKGGGSAQWFVFIHLVFINYQRLCKEKEQLECEKRELAALIEKRSKEVDRLNGECKELSKKFSEANQAKCEALAKVEEIHSQDVVAKYQKERFTQEIEQLQKQVEYLNGELEKKIRDQQNILKDKTSQLLQVQSELDAKTEEVKLCKENIESLKKVNNEQINKIENFNKKLKDARDDQIKMDFQFQQELQAQTKLVTLYKGLSEESEEKVKELTRAVSELQKLYKETSEAQTQQEKSKDAEKKRFMDQLETKDKKIQSMEKELSNANDLLSKSSKTRGMTDESIAALSPTAAATSKLLKSGMTLTQIYNEYVQAVDELHLEKEENKRINGYLDQIMQEIEEKAPILRQQREDYEHALHTITQLTQKLDTAMEEGQKLRSEADESRRRLTYVQKENKKFTQQSVDLGQQVQYLLREVEELRGGHIVADEAEVSSTEVTSSSQLITNRLVTFKNVQELQEQNQRLLEVVRELSDKREEEEQEVTDAKTLELKQSLENALEELKDLKASRARQEELAESIIRQRDMYRVLFQQSSQQVANVEISTPFRGRGGRGHYNPRGRGALLQTPQRPFPVTPISPISPNKGKELEDTKMALQELQTEYNTYKREKGEYEKMLNAQLEKLRSEISDIRVQNTQLSSQLDFASERYKVLQNNADCYKKEINTLKEQNKKYSLQSVRLEQNVSTLHSDLVTAQENISRLEVRCQNLSSERDLLKAAEQRLVQEKETMLKEQHSQNVLLSNLQTIQNNMERVENETKSRLNHQVEVAEKELINIKRKLENAETEHKNTIQRLENKMSSLQNQLDGEMKAHQKSKDTILDITRHLNTQKQELSATQSKLACAETKLSKSFGTMDTRGSGTPTIHAPNEGESLAVKDLKCLKDQLEKSRKHVDQYKAISESLENSLKDQNKASQHFSENTEKKLENLKEENETKTKKIEILEKEKEELAEDNTKLAEEKHKMITDLRKQLSNLQNELHESIQSRKTAIANEQAARESCQTQAKLAAEAQDKYQRELMLHAADMEAMSTLKKEAIEHSQKLEAAKEEAKQATATLTEAKNSWTEQERIMKNENGQIESRCTDLNRQNAILHEQLGQLSKQVAYIQKSAESSDILNTSIEEKEKSSEQLLEVIRFLRKEKEISVTRVEVAEAETLRMKQRLENLQKQYEETCKNLSEERERSQVNVHTASQHAELMRKVENLNVLSESNAMLRQEKEKLNGVVKELTTKVKKLEDDIQPLQSNIRELNSQKDTLTIEKNNLTGEVERWKARTSRLIEQCNKSDPEEHRRIVQEREDLKKQVSTLNEDNHKKKAEISRITITHSNTLKELNAIKIEANKKDSELTTLRNQLEELNKEMETKNKDVEEKAKTISQLKKIGRKYKDQAEDTAKQLSELRDNQQMQPTSEGSNQQAMAEANEMLETAKKKAEEADKKLQEEQQLRATLEQEINEIKAKNTELENNQLKSKNVLQNAKAKITTQKEQLERLTSEVTEQKRLLEDVDKAKIENVLRENTIKSQYEGRISNLERELEEARQNATAASVGDMKQVLERLQKENAELQAKVQQMQKQLEVKQKQQPSVSRATTPAVSADRLSLPVGETPKMANIRPMTSTTPASVRQTSAQPMMSAAAAAKATASIRPMAIAPTTASPVSATTPTATVMPTTITSQESHDGITDSPPSTISQLSSAVPLTGRPTQQIQRVTPQIEVMQEPSVPATTTFSPMQMEMTSVITSAASSATSATVQVSTLSGTITTSTSTADETDRSEPQPSTSSPTGQSQQPQPSTSQSGNKRSRDDTDVSEEDNQVKRSKTGQASMGSIPVITVTDEQTQTTILSSTDAQKKQDETSELTQTYQETELEVEDDEDEDDDDVDEIPDEEEDEDDEDDEIESYNETLASTQPYTETGDDDVVIVEDDDEETNVRPQVDPHEEDEQRPPDQDNSGSQAASGPIPMGTNAGQRSTPQLLPLPTQTTDRLPASGSSGSAGRSQLTPFMFQGPPGPFEEGDDCTVPSTPTLCVPRRTDGFAEAVNYPQVPQRFVFGPGDGVGPSELASQGALGMDDTRMDLSQFDDGQTRNVPTTPHQITPLGGSASGVFGSFQVTSAPPQQILQGDSEASKEGSSQESASASVPSEMPGSDTVAEGGEEETSTAEKSATDDGNPSVSGEQSLEQTSEDDGDRSALDPQGLRKTRIQPIVWDQTSGQQQQQQQQQQQAASTATTPSPSSAIQTQPYSSSGSAPGTSSNVTAPPTKGRGGANVANTQPRGGPAAANVRNMRGGANARGRGAVMRGHMARGQMVRGHVGRGRNPGVRGPAGRSRGSLRRQT
ncbi:TPR [Acanthosepion pharaonis]|uniref:Nucleoprotein TPR n=1 Tax=Acanthosepion pharaonis TaxID=158019 RepID=A0A812BS44_ACAPH|nr:TPR [Sepia pharaonis]